MRMRSRPEILVPTTVRGAVSPIIQVRERQPDAENARELKPYPAVMKSIG
jgi:hypothetical protein